MSDNTIKVDMLLKWWGSLQARIMLQKTKHNPFRVKEPNVNLVEEWQAPQKCTLERPWDRDLSSTVELLREDQPAISYSHTCADKFHYRRLEDSTDKVCESRMQNDLRTVCQADLFRCNETAGKDVTAENQQELPHKQNQIYNYSGK